MGIASQTAFLRRRLASPAFSRPWSSQILGEYLFAKELRRRPGMTFSERVRLQRLTDAPAGITSQTAFSRRRFDFPASSWPWASQLLGESQFAKETRQLPGIAAIVRLGLQGLAGRPSWNRIPNGVAPAPICFSSLQSALVVAAPGESLSAKELRRRPGITAIASRMAQGFAGCHGWNHSANCGPSQRFSRPA